MHYLTLPIDPGYEDEIRSKCGAFADELPNEVINTKVVIGAAELFIFEYVGSLDLEALTEREELYINLAFICASVYFAWPGLKLRVLQIETDNKTSGQRFAKAFDDDPIKFLNEAKSYMQTIVGFATTEIELLSISKPATDTFTGNSNAA